MALETAESAALAEAKGLANEIHDTVNGSLAIQSVGGTHVLNLVRNLLTKLEQVEESPEIPAPPVDEHPGVTVTPPEPVVEPEA